MKIAPLAEVKTHFSSYVDDCRRSPVVVTRNGRAAAILIAAPEDEEELERLLLSASPRLRQLLDDAMGRVAQGQGVSHDEMWRAVSEGATGAEEKAPAKRAPRRRKAAR